MEKYNYKNTKEVICIASNKVYIKLEKKVSITSDTSLKISDIAKVIADDILKKEIEEIKIYDIGKQEKSLHSVDIVDVINKIRNVHPEVDIESIGEQDIVIEYLNGEKRPSKMWEFVKIVFVCLTIFFGASVAIMTFHTDVAMTEVHQQIYKMLTGNSIQKPYIIQIPYSIGLAVGIIVFFNHFWLKFKNSPTPLEVEIDKYQDELYKCTVEKIKKRNLG
ncbi:MAG TPA: hypothetical protein DEP72_04350 [Clostridiales bacterium]|nr:MAG: hypothetical protein A2Y18_04770 [Clostridiales bacterium GWD2_32_19]HCC07372.1 hypothetical protein [Clostridiales bacterium]